MKGGGLAALALAGALFLPSPAAALTVKLGTVAPEEEEHA